MTEPMNLGEPARPDGYEPLGIGLMVYAGLTEFPRDKEFWYLISAARRLDAAHRLFEQVRKAIYFRKTTKGSIEDLFVLLGDVELAMVALHRAVDMAHQAGAKLKVTGTRWPDKVKRKQKAIEELRNAYEHIDERALGKISKRKADKQQAHTIFANVYGRGDLGGSLVRDRKLTYRQWSLGIDDEATELFVAVRKYLRNAGVEVIDRRPR